MIAPFSFIKEQEICFPNACTTSVVAAPHNLYSKTSQNIAKRTANFSPVSKSFVDHEHYIFS